MKTMTTTEINELDEGMPIPHIEGRVKIVFDRKSGIGDYGEWSFQDAILQFGETEISLKFKNMEDMKELQGKDVTIDANKSKTHGWTGVTKIVHDYQGKIYHKVQLTPSCKIRVNQSNGTTEQDEIPMTHDTNGKALPGVDEARHHLMRAANLYNMCADAVDAVIKPNIENMSAELFQAAIGTLFIEASRAGFVAKMPDKPIPANWRSPTTFRQSQRDTGASEAQEMPF